jgi:hypothetical protein
MEPARMSATSAAGSESLADAPGFIAGRPLLEWNTAYTKVERYFQALGMRNKLLLGQLVARVLDRAIERAPAELDRTPMALAAEEMDRAVTAWYAAVLDVPLVDADPLLSTRGRLALLLADMPDRWQDQFLKPDPWPEEFVGAMRASYLRAGPDFQLSQMDPRPIDLGPIVTLTNLGNIAWARMLLAWLAFAAVLVVIFNMTR